MLKTVRFGETVLRRAKNFMIIERTFLSEAYQCNEAWNRRLEESIIKKINPNDMFFQLEQKFNTDGKASAVDVDIFANSVQEKHQVDELVNIILRHRASPETTSTLDSTHHAVIRYLMKHDCIDLLHEILNDRVHYGIFPDNHIMNVLMDTFIKKNEFALAAKIAVLSMLQEDTSNPLTNALSIYSCHKYLEDPDTWKVPEPEPEDTKEVIKVRVAYLRNPYFDDHFDLIDPRDLVGKTLAFHGKHLENCLGRSCRLRGLTLYKKYDQAIKLVDEWSHKDVKHIIHKDVYDLIARDISHLPEDQISEDFKKLQLRMKQLDNERLNGESFDEAIENNVKSAVEKQAEKDVAEQLMNYDKWKIIREDELKRHLAEQDRLSRLEHIQQLKREMEEKELLVTFFDKEEDIELAIEEKERKEQKEIERLGNRYTKAMTRMKTLGEEKFMDVFMNVKKNKADE